MDVLHKSYVPHAGHVGRAIRQVRESQGMSQGLLAYLVQVHWTTISRHEREESKSIEQALLVQIARALGTNTDTLWERAGSLPANPRTSGRPKNRAKREGRS